MSSHDARWDPVWVEPEVLIAKGQFRARRWKGPGPQFGTRRGCGGRIWPATQASNGGPFAACEQ